MAESKPKAPPRASLSVTLLTDPDRAALMLRHRGAEAFGIFSLLLIMAKERRNGGCFQEPLPVVAAMLQLQADDLRCAIELIAEVARENGNEPWVLLEDDRITIRSYERLNPPHGGTRANAGRPPKEGRRRSKEMGEETGVAGPGVPVQPATRPADSKRESSGNQVAPLDSILPPPPIPTSDSDSVVATATTPRDACASRGEPEVVVELVLDQPPAGGRDPAGVNSGGRTPSRGLDCRPPRLSPPPGAGGFPAAGEAMAELVAIGVSRRKAVELSTRCSLERVREVLAHVQAADPVQVRDPAALAAWMLATGEPVPDSGGRAAPNAWASAAAGGAS